jgi:hypothetical protein
MADFSELTDYLRNTTREKIHLTELIKLYGDDLTEQNINNLFPLDGFSYDPSSKWIFVNTERFINNRMKAARRQFYYSVIVATLSLLISLLLLSVDRVLSFFLYPLAFLLMAISTSLVIYQLIRLLNFSSEYDSIYIASAATTIMDGAG